MYVRAYAKKKPLGGESKGTEKGTGGEREPEEYPSDFDHGSGEEEDEDEDDETWEKRVFTLNDADNDFSFTMDAMQCLQVETLPYITHLVSLEGSHGSVNSIFFSGNLISNCSTISTNTRSILVQENNNTLPAKQF